VNMKNNVAIAAAALLGAANAGMHRMKLQKVPLEEQLVSCDLTTAISQIR
jgi:saccharopepsin